jgi:hypothetical protein
VSGSHLPGVTSHDSLALSMRQRAASRRRRARNDRARPEIRPACRRHASQCQTARSAVCAAQPLSFPRRMFCVRVVTSLCLLASPLPSPTTARACAPKPWSSSAPTPEPRGRRSAGRRTTLNFVAPVRRDATLARRSRPAQPGRRLSALHRGVCPRPAASPAMPEPGQGWLAGHYSWAAASAGRVPSAVTSREPDATSPLRLLDRLRKTPLTSEDGNLLL